MPLEKAHALMGYKPQRYALTNIVNFDIVNDLIVRTIKEAKSCELIFVFGLQEPTIEWSGYNFFIDGQGIVGFTEPFSFYYDIKFIDLLKSYREIGYMVFLLYSETENGVVIHNATINWNKDGLSIYEVQVPDGFKTIDIGDIGISQDGQLMFGRVSNNKNGGEYL